MAETRTFGRRAATAALALNGLLCAQSALAAGTPADAEAPAAFCSATVAPLQASAPLVSQAERDSAAKLASSRSSVRRQGLEELAELRSRGMSGEMAKLATSDPDAGVRRAAVDALGIVRDPERIGDMVAVLGDADEGVRLAAVRALVGLYLDRDAGFFTSVRSTVLRVVPFVDERRTATVEPYDEVDARITSGLAKTMLGDASASVRIASVRALGALLARSQVDAMADAMASDERLRPEVLDAYVLIGDTDAARYATPLFEDKDAKLATQAMIAAGRLRAAQSVGPLLAVYGKPEPEPGVVESVKRSVTFTPERRKAALQALALIGDPRAEKVFRDNIYDNDAEVRRAAWEGLARESDPRFFDLAARNKLIEKDESVRLAELFAIYKMGHAEVFPKFIEALDVRGRRDQATQYLYEADSPSHLVAQLRTRNPEAQRIVIEALGAVGDMRAADELRPFVRGTTPEISTAADRAIRRIEWRASTRGAADAAPGSAPVDPNRPAPRPRRVGEP